VHSRGRAGARVLEAAGLTAEKFAPNPYGQEQESGCIGAGTWGGIWENGQIEYLGRKTSRSKCGAIALNWAKSKPSSENATASPMPSSVAERSDSDLKRVVAFVVADATIEALRKYVHSKLPEYMVAGPFCAHPAPAFERERKGGPDPPAETGSECNRKTCMWNHARRWRPLWRTFGREF